MEVHTPPRLDLGGIDHQTRVPDQTDQLGLGGSSAAADAHAYGGGHHADSTRPPTTEPEVK